MVTHQSMMDKADKISDYYTQLQQDIFNALTDATTSQRALLNDRKRTMEWRVQCLSKMGALTKETVKMVAKTTGKTQKAINELVKVDGLSVAKNINSELSDMLDKKVAVSPEIKSIVNSYAKQTFRDINNNVNQTLMSYNYRENPAMKTYQDIINKTVLEVQTGLKTPQRALADNIYKWQSAGLKTGMVDRGGHNWSLEGYTRTVIQSTAHRTFNDVRLQSMKDFDSPLAVMSSHPASRRACAFIQGHVVNVVPPEDKRFNSRYDSIYNHGYGLPQGTQGINCRHILYPYVEGVSHNYQKQYDPDKAVINSQAQQRQRYLERQIRNDKHQIETAKRLKDDEGLAHYKSMLSRHRKALRKHVASHDFLTRQPARERIIGNRPIKKTDVSANKASNPDVNPVEKVKQPTKATAKTSAKAGEYLNSDAVKTFGTQTSQNIADYLSKSPNDVQHIWKKYASNIKVGEFNDSVRSSYNPETKVINLNKKDILGTDRRAKYESLFHEYAHGIDDLSGRKSIDYEFRATLDSDYKAFMKNEQKEFSKNIDESKLHQMGKKMYYDIFEVSLDKKGKLSRKSLTMLTQTAIRQKLEKLPASARNDASDMVDAATNGKFNFGAYHGKKYWANLNMQGMEAFAHMTSATVTNPEALKLIKKIFPNAYDMYLKMIKKIGNN